jgi:hypothetical protein
MSGKRPAPNVEVGDEFIANVQSSAAFAVTQYSVNPGLAATFPWLYRKAALYEKYRFLKLEFYYKPTVTEFGTNAGGKIVYSADYDASDPAPTSKQQMEDTFPHGDGLPCKAFGCRLDKADMEDSLKWHYVRSAAVPIRTDVKMYDVANLNVGSQGSAGAGDVGELRVRYVCEFKDPVLEATAGAATNTSVSLFQSAAAETGGATTVNVNLLAATAVTNPLGIVNTAGSFVPPAGNYIVDANITQNNTSATVNKYEYDLFKNGATVYAGATLHPTFTMDAGYCDNNEATISYFVVANGTDAFTFPVKQTGAAAGTLWGSVRWTAV